MGRCACWSPAFTGLLHSFLLNHPGGGKETVLGDVFDAALAGGMKVKGLPFPEGQYMDIGTAAELDSALKRFHL